MGKASGSVRPRSERYVLLSAVASRLFAPPHVRHAGASRPSVESRLVAPGVWPGEWSLTWLVASSVPYFSCSTLRGGHANLQILASCSFDQNCYIWEEHGESGVVACVSKLCLLLTLCHTRTEGVGTNTGVRWQKTAQLCDARESVNDCKFAPRHMGLKLVRHGCARVSTARVWTSLSILCAGDCFGRRLRSNLRGCGCDELVPLAAAGVCVCVCGCVCVCDCVLVWPFVGVSATRSWRVRWTR